MFQFSNYLQLQLGSISCGQDLFISRHFLRLLTKMWNMKLVACWALLCFPCQNPDKNWIECSFIVKFRTSSKTDKLCLWRKTGMIIHAHPVLKTQTHDIPLQTWSKNMSKHTIVKHVQLNTWITRWELLSTTKSSIYEVLQQIYHIPSHLKNSILPASSKFWKIPASRCQVLFSTLHWMNLDCCVLVHLCSHNHSQLWQCHSHYHSWWGWQCHSHYYSWLGVTISFSLHSWWGWP